MNIRNNSINKSLFVSSLCAISILFFTNCSGEMNDDDLLEIYSQYDQSFGYSYSPGGYRKAKKENLEKACSDHGFTVNKFFAKYKNDGENFLRRYYKRKYQANSLRELPGYQYSGYGYHK